MLAFPSNDFGNQEPESNEKIRAFCREKFDVTFDMFAKVSIKGEKQCDLYGYLTDEKAGHNFGGDVAWNFQKYLIDRQGKIIAKFSPRDTPDDPKVIEAIEKALSNS